MRAEPNITMVSAIPSFLSCAKGWRYSARMRRGRAGVLSRNLGSSWGAFGACWGLSLGWPADMAFYLPKMQTIIVGIAAACGNVFRRGCVELSTLRNWAFLAERQNEAKHR